MKKARLFYTAFPIFKALVIKNYKTFYYQLLDLSTLTNFFCSHAGMVLLLQGPCWSTIFWICAGNYKTVTYRFTYPHYSPRLPTRSGLPPLPLLPPHWFSTKCSHDSPFYSQKFPYPQQIHTQALAENRTHTQQSPHLLPPHRSYILKLSHSAIFS